ncbi:MAG TPA: hypothetical protein VF816_11445, partial [Rhodocyclaceae bacterium]
CSKGGDPACFGRVGAYMTYQSIICAGSMACLSETLKGAQIASFNDLTTGAKVRLVGQAVAEGLAVLNAGVLNELASISAASRLAANNGVGKLIGSTENLTAAEKSFVSEMVAGGKTVEIIPTSTGRTADFIIDGTRYELKTMSNVVNQSSDGLSKALSSTIMDARGQSGNIIIDARAQPGMTSEIAQRGAIRAFGADNKDGSKIQSISVITSQGTVYVPRLP